ncbi:hypothetical protein Cylst_3658 [Cylindrospermum stagnale PCC 7417]|uniref:Uncharacterized protein n=1 Tax=Cylindrospermum stagnale PCC 7417 TaxID=56107 RepID=K9X206_9NOST|nr:hypothetical protein [Cylindrospermum stagnale]AFZ25782.1 hypothetical protein Cylst_3658 [Cylindrospermum stagnale PCC 7417]
MSLQELQEQAFRLSVRDRLTLINVLVKSLQTIGQIEDWQYL